MSTAQVVSSVNAEVSAAAVNLAKLYSPSDYPSYPPAHLVPYAPAYSASRRTARYSVKNYARASEK